MTNWKGFGRKRLWPNFKILSWHSPGGTEKNHENLSHDSQYPGRDLNPEPPGYKTGVLTTRLWHSVLRIVFAVCINEDSLLWLCKNFEFCDLSSYLMYLRAKTDLFYAMYKGFVLRIVLKWIHKDLFKLHEMFIFGRYEPKLKPVYNFQY
jgi:hypothetical protein